MDSVRDAAINSRTSAIQLVSWISILYIVALMPRWVKLSIDADTEDLRLYHVECLPLSSMGVLIVPEDSDLL
jgi:hypothetical protein